MNNAYEKVMETVYANEQMAFESWNECVDYVKYRRYPEVYDDVECMELTVLMSGAKLLDENGEDITEKVCIENYGIKYEDLEIHTEWAPLIGELLGISRAKNAAKKRRHRR